MKLDNYNPEDDEDLKNYIRPETKEFFANLRDVDDVVLEEKQEDLYVTHVNPKSVKYSANYVQD